METIRIRFREDTAKNWEIANPVLASSEPGRETDTGKFKIGDGKTNWNDLPYATSEVKEMDNTEVLSAITNTNADITNTINTNNANITTLLTQLQDSVNNLNSQPSVPSKTFEQYLAENGLCKVNYKYNNEDHYQIVPVGSVFDYSIKIPSTQAVLMGWIREDTSALVLRIEESCTLIPFIYSLNNQAEPFSMAHIFKVGGVMENITNPLSNGLEYSIFNKVEEFDFDIKYDVYMIGLSTTSHGNEHEITNNMTLELFNGNIYYGIYYCPQLNKIYSHENYHITVSEMIYGDQIKEVNYMTLAGAGYGPLENADLMDEFNFNDVVYDFKGWVLDAISTTVDNINVYKCLKSSEATNYTYHAIYECRNIHDGVTYLMNASNLQNLYDILVHTLSGDFKLSYNDLHVRNFYENIGRVSLHSTYFATNPDATDGNRFSTYDLQNNGIREAWVVYVMFDNMEEYTINQINNLPRVFQVWTLDNMIEYNIPVDWLFKYIPDQFSSNGETYSFTGWSDSPDSIYGLDYEALKAATNVYPITGDSLGNGKTYNESVALYANKSISINIWGIAHGLTMSTTDLYNDYDNVLSQFNGTIIVNDEEKPLTAVGFCYNTSENFCISKDQLLSSDFIYSDLYAVYRTDTFDGITQMQIGNVHYETVDVAPEQISINKWYYLNNNSHFNVSVLDDQLNALGLRGSEMSHSPTFEGLFIDSSMVVTNTGVINVYIRTTTVEADDWTPMSQYYITDKPDFSQFEMGQFVSITIPFRAENNLEYTEMRIGIGASPTITYMSADGMGESVYEEYGGWKYDWARRITFESELATGNAAEDWLIANSNREL